jgi:hypothetical protein
MSNETRNQDSDSSRIALIRIIKTPLAFYVFIAMMAETVLGSIVATSSGEIQRLSLYGIVIVFILLLLVFTLLAFLNPAALIGSFTTSKELNRFCRNISGKWWDKIISGNDGLLSYVNIRYLIASNSLKLIGTEYTNQGKISAFFESLSTNVNLNDSKVYYYFKGYKLSNPESPYEGYGEILFDYSKNKIEKGDGLFVDINLADFKNATRISTRLIRPTKEEIEIMQSGDSKSKSECIKNALSLFGE